MADYPIASDLSFQVFQRRRRLSELPTPQLDETNRRRHADVQQARVVLRGNVGAFDVSQLIEEPVTPIRDRHVR